MANAIAYGGRIINAGSGGGDTTLWTDTVECAIGDTTCTIEDENLSSTSTIDAYSECASGACISITNIVVTNGSATLTFPELEEATSFKIHILN